MAGETTITVIGNLVDDPELRFTPSGAPVANFRIASTPRTFDRQTNEWKDGDTLFLSCAVWRQAAENVAESLQRGMRVIVQGRLKSRQYETREGEKRTVFEIDVEEVGPSLRSASAKVTKTTRSGGGGGYSGGGGGGGGYSGGGGQSSAPADDPWASPAPAQGGGKAQKQQRAVPQAGKPGVAGRDEPLDLGRAERGRLPGRHAVPAPHAAQRGPDQRVPGDPGLAGELVALADGDQAPPDGGAAVGSGHGGQVSGDAGGDGRERRPARVAAPGLVMRPVRLIGAQGGWG